MQLKNLFGLYQYFTWGVIGLGRKRIGVWNTHWSSSQEEQSVNCAKMLNTILLTGIVVKKSEPVIRTVIQSGGDTVGYVTLQSVAMEGFIITDYHGGSVV